MLEASKPHVVADDVQNSHHLAEDQHPKARTRMSACTCVLHFDVRSANMQDL